MLAKNKDTAHVPYRDSKLTCLLKPSLSGESYCIMIACISPSDHYWEENLSTLEYASKASRIVTNPKKNQDYRAKLIGDLQSKVKALQDNLIAANKQIEKLTISQPIMEEEKTDTLKSGYESSLDKNTVVETQSINDATPNAYEASQIIENKHSSENALKEVDTIKKILKSNMVLRDTIKNYEVQIASYKANLYESELENDKLREKVSVLEKALASRTSHSRVEVQI